MDDIRDEARAAIDLGLKDRRGTTIGLDYDGTYTLGPEVWDRFILLAQSVGWTVLCVTMRRPEEPVVMPYGVEVIYTARRAKIEAVAAMGRKIDIWIDDSPFWLFTDG